jgi:mannosyltransferase OCH1-like enzyme
MPAKLSKPNSFYVRGRDLVLNEYTQPANIGEIPMFIHQTWKSDIMKQDYVNSFDNWSKLHPGFTHVLWTDEDNDLLVSTWFPQYLPVYNWLPIVIQKTDFARLMYLYRYGGIYADMDYECYQALPPCLPQLCGFMAVQSPFSLNENLQNSLMISSPGHPVILAAMDIINQTVLDLKARKKYPFNLKNKLIGPLVANFITLGLTGPQVLDKAVSRLAAQNKHIRSELNVAQLDASFFKGPVAAHLQHNTWVKDLPKKCMPLIMLAVFAFLVLLAMVVLITHYAGKRR